MTTGDPEAPARGGLEVEVHRGAETGGARTAWKSERWERQLTASFSTFSEKYFKELLGGGDLDDDFV